MATNRQLAQKGQRLAEAADEAREETAAGRAAAGGFSGERLAQETTAPYGSYAKGGSELDMVSGMGGIVAPGGKPNIIGHLSQETVGGEDSYATPPSYQPGTPQCGAQMRPQRGPLAGMPGMAAPGGSDGSGGMPASGSESSLHEAYPLDIKHGAELFPQAASHMESVYEEEVEAYTSPADAPAEVKERLAAHDVADRLQPHNGQFEDSGLPAGVDVPNAIESAGQAGEEVAGRAESAEETMAGTSTQAAAEQVTGAAQAAQETAAGTVATAGQANAEMAGCAGVAAESMKEMAAGAAQVAAQQVTGAVQAAKETAADALQVVQEKVAGAVESTRQATQQVVERAKMKLGIAPHEGIIEGAARKTGEASKAVQQKAADTADAAHDAAIGTAAAARSTAADTADAAHNTAAGTAAATRDAAVSVVESSQQAVAESAELAKQATGTYVEGAKEVASDTAAAAQGTPEATADLSKATASGLGETAATMAQGAKQAAVDTATYVRDTAAGAAESTKQAAGQAVQSTKEAVTALPDTVKQAFERGRQLAAQKDAAGVVCIPASQVKEGEQRDGGTGFAPEDAHATVATANSEQVSQEVRDYVAGVHQTGMAAGMQTYESASGGGAGEGASKVAALTGGMDSGQLGAEVCQHTADVRKGRQDEGTQTFEGTHRS